MSDTAWRFAAVLAVLALLTVGCGGGGGDGSPRGLLSGPYHFLGISAIGLPAEDIESTWGHVVSDGAGKLLAATASNDNGSYTGPGLEDDIPYEIATDLSMIVRDPTDLLHVMASGWINAAGTVALLGSTHPGDDPALWVTVKRQGTFTAADLGGDWGGCGWVMSLPGHHGFAGPFSFDGVDSGSGAPVHNNDGTVTPGGLVFTYTVSDQNRVSLDIANLGTFEGGIHPNGQAMVLAGCTTDNQPPAFFAFARKPTAPTLALLSGTYALTGIEHDPAAGTYRSSVGTAVSDGGGNLSVTMAENVEGVVAPGPAAAATYAFGATGYLTLVTDGGMTLDGVVSPDGTFAVMGGGTSAGASPMIYLLAR